MLEVIKIVSNDKTKKMYNDAMNSGAAESNKDV
jgi:hypothetical protein